MGFGIGNGIAKLVQRWGKGISNAADKVWLRADAQKAIRDEVLKKYTPRIDRANKSESRRAESITELGDKLVASKKALQDAKKDWQDKYDAALANAKSQRQADIDGYDQQLKSYEDALNKAEADRQNIFNQLYDSEDNYNISKTILTDVNNGEKYLYNSATGKYVNLTQLYPQLSPQQKRGLSKAIKGYDNRLFDSSSNRVINAFDINNLKAYKGSNVFDSYRLTRRSTRNADLRDADDQINKADSDLNNWKTNNSKPQAWDNADSRQFGRDFRKTNGNSPTEFTFNGKTYADEAALDADYKKAVTHLKDRQDYFKKHASELASDRDAEIAQRIQDAKDMNKAKVALGGTLGAGALYAAARAMYGGDDTDNTDNTNTNNTDNTNNTNNTDITDYGEPDPDFNVKNIPGAKDQLADALASASSDTGFDPDKAKALASASYDAGVEDGNRIEASTGGHTIDDELYKLLKDMQDPYKADAVANYIYSKHGNNSEVQRLGWRGWLNKYYGDALRSIMNIDPSGYKGMHISGGL